jgi:hypothetical protein
MQLSFDLEQQRVPVEEQRWKTNIREINNIYSGKELEDEHHYILSLFEDVLVDEFQICRNRSIKLFLITNFSNYSDIQFCTVHICDIPHSFKILWM